MPILNYTTTVSAERTIGEITSMLVRKGARSISSEFAANGHIEAVTFVMLVGGVSVRFLLPSNSNGVAKAILKERPWTTRSRVGLKEYEAKIQAQAQDVSWRILKDWVEAQLALIESGQAEMGQVFLPYAQQADGRTMYELFVENNQKQLGTGATA